MNQTYTFSFTATSLRLNEMIRVAKSTVENKEIDYAIEIGNGKEATGKRILSEIRKRITQLTHDQLKILANGDYTNQIHIAFLAVCKTYGFIRDFVIEVLRENLLVFDYQISEGEYITFYRKKAELYPTMESLTEVTQKKVRQVVFTILEQAGIIDSTKNKMIQPQILEPLVIRSIVEDDAQWLKVFLINDIEITNIKAAL